ncbi:MAG: prephenate dehydrogenase/arogenate dehydrogenase family protein [Acidobacteriota bacterium]|jgi:prephenate dehydrogenase|nr:prephenate dehydrogenase/arogenate dehydrogenase family protein [Acidobacteriota bacterium]
MKITIIGCGLIGGSLGLALKRRLPEHAVACLDLPERIPAIQEAAVADSIGTLDDFAAHIPGSDLVVIATPVQFVLETLVRLKPFLKAGAVVTDVGSTKERIMAEAPNLLPSGVHFIGGHPMAGGERSGVEAADPLLFSDRVYALCPYQDTPPEALLAMIELVEGLGAVPVTIEPGEHDRVVAMVSHLPHFISLALMHAALAGDAEHGMLEKMAGRGFLDMTRLAASDYAMWRGVMETNAAAIGEAMARFDRSLRFITEKMGEPEGEAVWERAAQKRRTMAPESVARSRRQDLRSVIDRQDKLMLSVLARRFDAVRKIGRLKMRQAAPVVDSDRERRMMVERRDWGKSLNLPEEMVEELFAVILKHSSRLQATES